MRIWRKSPKELVETERTGVGVVFANWSGPASAWLATLVRLVEQHPAPIRLFVMDSDDATRRAASRRSRELRAGRDSCEPYLRPDHLLCLGDDGGSDQSVFAISANRRIDRTDIFRRVHENMARG